MVQQLLLQFFYVPSDFVPCLLEGHEGGFAGISCNLFVEELLIFTDLILFSSISTKLEVAKAIVPNEYQHIVS